MPHSKKKKKTEFDIAMQKWAEYERNRNTDVVITVGEKLMKEFEELAKDYTGILNK